MKLVTGATNEEEDRICSPLKPILYYFQDQLPVPDPVQVVQVRPVMMMDNNDKGIRMVAPRRPSVFGSDKRHCLCHVLRPLQVVLQVVGVFPITRHSESCNLTHSWNSLPALINYGWIIGTTLASIFIFTNISTVLNALTSGTDFYTYVVNTMISLIACNVIYVFGNRSAKIFGKGWDIIHGTIDELALPNFRMVKRTVYLLPVLLIEEFIIDLGIILYLYYFKSSSAMQIENTPLTAGLSMFLINFVPNIICGSYTVLCWIVTINFNAINGQIKTIMRESAENYALVSTIVGETQNATGAKRNILKGQKSVVKSAQFMARLRLLHENLCNGMRCLEKAFGFQLLGIFCSTGFSIVSGIYGVITSSTGLLNNVDLENMSLAFSIQNIVSGSRLLVVLVISQYVMNKSNEAGHILNSYELDIYTKDMQNEVETFQRKVGEYPMKITCCNVFSLSTSILAPAIGNIITYVLVLMQFKLNSRTATIPDG